LIASSNTEGEQLEWYGLVESKLRHLVTILERNQHIELPHIWPSSYPTIDSEGRPVTHWFIGLIFSRVENLNVDLTYDILTFTDRGKKYYYSFIFLWANYCWFLIDHDELF
jgi:poly(A) polymerase